MSTGIILGLGLITIVISFYIILNIPYWMLLWNKRKGKNTELEKTYHLWVYSSDDSLNKFLKFCIYCLYAFGIYLFFEELLYRHF